MQNVDFTTKGTPPQTFWQRNGSFIVVMTVLLGMLAWTHMDPGHGSAPAKQAQAAFMNQAWADMKTLFWFLLTMASQIAVLIFVLTRLWRFFNFLITILVGFAIFFVLWGHGFF
jgi:hypothetical protein